MKQIFIHDFFRNLIQEYGLKMKAELNEERYYMIEYDSGDFIIKIEKYFREFYATLYKIGKPQSEINLFNLLDYLKRDEKQVPKSEYFYNEKKH